VSPGAGGVGGGLRITERFTYDYNFTAGWRLDLHPEQRLPATVGRVYPRCGGGGRAGPHRIGPVWWNYLNAPSRTWCSRPCSARRTSSVSCWTPTRDRTGPAWAYIEVNWLAVRGEQMKASGAGLGGKASVGGVAKHLGDRDQVGVCGLGWHWAGRGRLL
jgi:hypothetical protein